MFVISTRNFPPELGGIQSLMGGLAENLLNYGPVKVFADKKSDQDNAYDEKYSLDVERISGIKLFRKYRKSGVVNEFVKILLLPSFPGIFETFPALAPPAPTVIG